MKYHFPIPIIILAILIFSLFNSYHLFKSWFDTPIEQNSWLLFIIWILPLPIYWIGNSNTIQTFTTSNFILAFLALLTGLISAVSSLNAPAYLGLALAITACLPSSKASLPWLASSISWMPALGWLLTHQFQTSKPLTSQLFRLGLVTIGVLWTVSIFNKQQEKTNE